MHDTKVDTFVLVAQLDRDHIISDDIGRAVRGSFETYSVDVSDAVTTFDWKEGRTDHIRSNNSIENADRQSQYVWLGSNAHVDLVTSFIEEHNTSVSSKSDSSGFKSQQVRSPQPKI